jgi:hypothetical protein
MEVGNLLNALFLEEKPPYHPAFIEKIHVGTQEKIT